MALLSAILFLTPNCVLGLELQSEWVDDAIVYPLNDSLVPAGVIQLEWNLLNDDVESYEVYFDDEYVASVDKTVNTYEVYTTDVDLHSYQIVAVLANDTRIESELVEFYVSKKGVAYNRVDLVQDLSASWYYNWGTSPNSSVNTNLEYVPMVWGAGNEASSLNVMKNKGYHTVLGYNEPENSNSGQSNVSVNTAIANAQHFIDSGLRFGSPAVERLDIALETNGWLEQYINGVGIDNIDFIAVHEYVYNVCTCGGDKDTKEYAKEFLDKVQNLYDKYQKPIWITEMGVVNWDQWWKHYSYESEAGKREVYQFMDYIINGYDDVKGLNDLEYVERYAWFPFDMQSPQAGASSLFVTETDSVSDSSLIVGELNNLGKLYRDSGNPEGYGTVTNIKKAEFTVNDVEYDGTAKEPTVKVVYNGEELVLNTDYTLSYSNNINVGTAKVIVNGIGDYRSTKEITFDIIAKDISKLSISSIDKQEYTGNAIEPSITIKDGNKVLVEDKDYEITYINNINVGKEAQIKVVGKGNYIGTIVKTFEIFQTDDSDADQTVDKPPYVDLDKPNNVDKDETMNEIDKTIPKTSDTTLIMSYTFMAMTSAIGFIYVTRKRKC